MSTEPTESPFVARIPPEWRSDRELFAGGAPPAWESVRAAHPPQPWPNDDPEAGPLVPKVEGLADWGPVEAAQAEVERLSEPAADTPALRPAREV